MADISDAIDPIVSAIYEQYEKRGNAEPARAYLGASIIGKECSRALWYDFRWCGAPVFDGRMYRLFQTGHLEEPRMIADLRCIGAEVYDVDPTNGRQFGFADHGGHMKGHMDGCARHIPTGGARWHVLEFKTHSAKSFADLKKNGVKKAKPQHYDQMTWYMGKTGMDRALYLAKNKDTDELYAERIEFDKVRFEQIQAKAAQIIFGSGIPPKLSDDPSYYLCKMCDHRAVCHMNRVPPISCRTCCHSTAEKDGDGRWSCAKAGPDSSIPVNAQRTGCPQHLPLPFLLTYAEPIDAGEGWIELKRKDNGLEFVVAAEGVTHPLPDLPLYSSREISAAADHKAIANPEIEAFRQQFDATLTG
jgi:hypothetical protein